MEHQLLKEYEILRKEIDNKIALHNSLLTFTITTTVAILTIAASAKITIINLLPFCVIIPMAARIAYYRTAMAKLSAYIIVFLEPELTGISWETRNYAFSQKHGGLSHKPEKYFLRYYECLFLSLMCYALFLVNYIPTAQFDFWAVFWGLCPVFLVAWVWYLTGQLNRVDQDRQALIESWQEIKQAENASATVSKNEEVTEKLEQIYKLLDDRLK